MKLIIDVEKDYYEQIKYNVEHGQEYKPFEIIANGISYDEQIEKIADLLEINWGWEGIREEVTRILKGGEI